MASRKTTRLTCRGYRDIAGAWLPAGGTACRLIGKREKWTRSRQLLGGAMVLRLFPFLLVAGALIVLPQRAEAQLPGSTAQRADTAVVRAWLANQNCAFSEMNARLADEGNLPLSCGLNAGLEFDAISSALPLLKIDFRAPMGLEYLPASTQTVHQDGGDRTLVSWKLPVIGFFVAPEFRHRTGLVKVKPLSIGLYTLGRFVDAGLTVSDRSGWLQATGTGVGYTTQASVARCWWPACLEASVGYRWLSFRDVSVRGRDGFTEDVGGLMVGQGALQDMLDYGGILLRVGFSFEAIRSK